MCTSPFKEFVGTSIWPRLFIISKVVHNFLDFLWFDTGAELKVLSKDFIPSSNQAGVIPKVVRCVLMSVGGCLFRSHDVFPTLCYNVLNVIRFSKFLCCRRTIDGGGFFSCI